MLKIAHIPIKFGGNNECQSIFQVFILMQKTKQFWHRDSYH